MLLNKHLIVLIIISMFYSQFITGTRMKSCQFIMNDDNFSNETNALNIMGLAWEPFLKFLNDSVKRGYHSCGPLMGIIKQVAEKLNYTVRLSPFRNGAAAFLQDFEQNKPHIILAPFSLDDNIKMMAETLNVKPSTFIGIQSKAHVISKMRKSSWPIFGYFLNFDDYTWTSIVMSILLISIIVGSYNNSLLMFMNTLWNYLIVLMLKSIVPSPRLAYERILASFWLIAATILVFIFGGELWSFLIKNQPFDKIDSWQDLHQYWKHLTIYSLKEFEMEHLLNNDKNSPMAIDFKRRTKFMSEYSEDWDFHFKIFQEILNGEAAFIQDKMTVEYLIKSDSPFCQLIKSLKIKNHFIHVAKHGRGVKPYHMFFSDRINSNTTQKINKIIRQLQESGIYEHWMKESLSLKGYESDYDEQIVSDAFKFKPLTLEMLKGVFILWKIGILTSMAIFLLELIVYHFTKILLK